MINYEGKCLGKADGKVVIVSNSVEEVMATLKKKYSTCVISISSIPKSNKIFIL